VVVNANQTVGNYWITAPADVRTSSNNTNCASAVDLELQFTYVYSPTVDPDTVYAVLHYEGASNADPTSTPPTANGTALLEYNMGSSVPRLAEFSAIN
jgi:iron transport multicopper oxidase